MRVVSAGVRKFYDKPDVLGLSLLLFSITAAVFFTSCFNGFIDAYDDELYVTLNRMVQNGLTLEGVRWAFTTLHAANWQPLAWLSHMVDVQLFGMKPFGHHLVSVLIHSLSSVLLFLLFLKLGIRNWTAWLCALLFAIHPQRVESVAWVAERKDVLSVFFGLLALYAYTGYARCRSRGRYAGVLFLFALSLMSKPMLLTLPLVMLLMDRFTDVCVGERRPWWPLIVEKLPFLFLSAGVALVTLTAQKADNAMVEMLLVTRIMIAASGFVEYIRLFLFPVGLSFHYPLETAWITAARCAFSLLVIAFLTAAIYRAREREQLVFGWFWFLITLFPVSGIIHFGGQFVADRYSYFPHIGLILMVAWFLERQIPQNQAATRYARGAVALFLIAAVFLTVRQASWWRDGETLYRRAIFLNSNNWLAHSNLGSVLLRQNRYGEAFLHMARSQVLRGNPQIAGEILEMAVREGAAAAEVEKLRKEIMAARDRQGR